MAEKNTQGSGYNLDSDYQKLIKNRLYMSGAKSLVSGFADAANSYIEYNNLGIEADTYKTQAGAIELAAQNQANALREQFISNVANAQYSAAARNVKTTSGNVVANMERSAKELGEDVSTLKKNAQGQAEYYRDMAKLQDMKAQDALYSGILGGASDVITGVSTAYSAYKMGQKQSGSKSGGK